jgi:ribose/xylose/arabinose/galactoside ABC-type transport system permease subunit
MPLKGLAGRRALVTGAASGIGSAVLERLIAEGVEARGTDIHPAAGLIVADLTDAQWDSLLPRARACRCLGRMAVAARTHDLAQLPDRVRDHLDAAIAEAAHGELIIRWELNRIERALVHLSVPVLLLMLAFGVLVGLVNGLITTLLKVQSLITTLGMMLVLYGAVRLWTGGAPTGALSEAFRQPGRGGIDMPVVRQLPWAFIILIGFVIAAIMLMRSSYGKTLIATGDNARAAGFSGARVWQVRTGAFVLSSVMATFAAVLIGGLAGVTAQVGEGLEFSAITAVVLGGVVLGGGRGTVIGAMGGALTLQALFTLFNQLALPSTIRPAAQGVIIIAAVAYAARERSRPVAPAEPVQFRDTETRSTT